MSKILEVPNCFKETRKLQIQKVARNLPTFPRTYIFRYSEKRRGRFVFRPYFAIIVNLRFEAYPSQWDILLFKTELESTFKDGRVQFLSRFKASFSIFLGLGHSWRNSYSEDWKTEIGVSFFLENFLKLVHIICFKKCFLWVLITVVMWVLSESESISLCCRSFLFAAVFARIVRFSEIWTKTVEQAKYFAKLLNKTFNLSSTQCAFWFWAFFKFMKECFSISFCYNSVSRWLTWFWLVALLTLSWEKYVYFLIITITCNVTALILSDTRKWFWQLKMLFSFIMLIAWAIGGYSSILLILRVW